MNIKLVRISLFFLLVIALLGTLMRGAAYIQIPLSYVHLLHSHSHTAFQGWIYTAMILIIVKLFLTDQQIQKGRYSLQFKFTSIVVLGILISFALQGYGLYSIIFSSLFQILNYWYIFTLIRDLKKNRIKPQKTQVQVSSLFIKTSLMLGLLSTLAPWFIGILSAKGLAETEAYQSFIFFFLHFQYNGWFLFASLGIFFRWLESDGEKYNYQKAKLFYYLFAAAVIPAWALSLLGMSYSGYILIPAVIAASLQLLSLMPFFQSIAGVYNRWQSKSICVRVFLLSSLAAFCIKICLQFLSVLPLFHEYAFFNRSVIIAYLHLSLIGVITFFFLSVMIHFQWLRVHLFTKSGCVLLAGGFISSEALLAASGIGVFYEPLGLLIFSIFMTLGVLLLLTGTFIKSPEPSVF